MNQPPAEMMDTHEVAEYLRVKERKVYELVRDKKIPCARVTGKWLFPRALIDEWLIAQTERPETLARRNAPSVIAGSHDPLLEWCVRESGCGLALSTGGSLDGLVRLAAGEAQMALIHLPDNAAAIRESLADQPVVAIEWACRTQGLVVAPGNPLGLKSLADLAKKRARVVCRQPEAGAQVLFERLLGEAGVTPADLDVLPALARSETDVGLAVLENRADAGMAVAAVAKTLRLDFVPLHEERCDLVLLRRDYFEPACQKLLATARTPAFAERAAALGGYEVSGLGAVRFNG